jgi:uncharacterized protein YndB with AHSA1/START domain
MKSIRREVVLDHPPARVWTALTDPRVLETWMMETTLQGEPRVGQRFQFRTKPAPGFDGIIECEVLEAVRPERFAYSWASGKGKKHRTRVEWTLTREGPGTRLVLEHSGFEGLMGYFMRAMMAGGWNKKVSVYLNVVARRLEVVADDVSRMEMTNVMECE